MWRRMFSRMSPRLKYQEEEYHHIGRSYRSHPGYMTLKPQKCDKLEMVFIVKCNRTNICVFMPAPMVTCGDQVTRLRRRVTLGTLSDGIEASYWSSAAAQVCYTGNHCAGRLL